MGIQGTGGSQRDAAVAYSATALSRFLEQPETVRHLSSCVEHNEPEENQLYQRGTTAS